MEILTELEALCGAYIEKVSYLERHRKLGAGILGFRGGPGDDPCHEAFSEDMRRLLSDYAATEPEAGDVTEVLSWLYAFPLSHRQEKVSYWMLLAVHVHTIPLMDRLGREDAKALRQAYAADYPRRERLPVQNQVLSALEAAEKGRR